MLRELRLANADEKQIDSFETKQQVKCIETKRKVKHCRVKSSKVDFSDTVPRFDLDDVAWEQYLKSNGYVVIKNIIDEKKVVELRNDVYTWCESHPSGGKVFKRDDPESWRELFLGNPSTGIVMYGGAGQADHM